MRLLPKPLSAFAFAGLLIAASHSTYAVEPDAPADLISRLDAVSINIQNKLEAEFRSATRFHITDQGALVEFYDERAYMPVWVDENGLHEKAKRIVAEIRRAEAWGLQLKDYDLPSDRNLSTARGPVSVRLSELELKMSYAVQAYARHASGGHVLPSSLGKNVDYNPQYADPVKIMQQMVTLDKPESALRDLHPKHPQFLRLKKKLAQLKGRKPEKRSSQPAQIPEGPNLRPGMAHHQVPLIRKRLGLKAYYDQDRLLYDEGLAEAVRDFQHKSGARPDGIVGPATRRAMNGSSQPKPSDTLNRILVNMERWRWLPNNLGRTHVYANVPEYLVRIVKNQRIVFTERMVVGKTTNPTPMFSDSMERVIFNPWWYPPRSIVLKEIIPGARRNSSFVQRQGLVVSNVRGRRIDPYYVDWHSDRVRNLSFRQPPGKGNVLGVVKFQFPNKHQVYMHDTPTKSLFNKEVRAYSHGCMRVRNPRQFAEELLRQEKGWSAQQIDRVIAKGQNYRVELSRRIPVHTTYFTTWIEDNGEMTSFGDIYGRDANVLAALNGRSFIVNNIVETSERRRPRRKKPSFNPFWSLFSD